MTIREAYDRDFRHEELTPSNRVRGKVPYLACHGHGDGKDELVGTDTFVIHDDLIQMHTFYATTPNLTVDDDESTTSRERGQE